MKEFSGPVIDHDVLVGPGVPKHYESDQPYFYVEERLPFSLTAYVDTPTKPRRSHRWRFLFDFDCNGWLLDRSI